MCLVTKYIRNAPNVLENGRKVLLHANYLEFIIYLMKNLKKYKSNESKQQTQ